MPTTLRVVLLAALGACADEQGLAKARGVCLRPEGVDFGEQIVRTAATRQIAITSCGGVPIDALSVSVVGEGEPAPGGVPFAVEATEVELPLEPGEHFLLPLRFRPVAAGAFAAELQLRFGDEGGPASAASDLSGVGIVRAGCDAAVLDDALLFASTEVGAASTMSFGLRNQGDADCALSGARITEGHADFGVSRAPDAILAPGAATSVEITFRPSGGGERAGAAAVVAADAGPSDVATARQLTVELAGNATVVDACRIAFEPATLTFPRATAGIAASATTASVALRSAGALACTLDSLTFPEGAGDFTLDAGPAAGTVLAPGEAATATVRFAPAQSGERTGVLRVSTSDGGSSDVALRGFADAAPVCAFRFTPSPLVFTAVGVGLSSEQNLTATNTSVLDCDVQSADVSALSSDFEIAVPPPYGMLAPGASVAMRVRFRPQSGALALGEVALTTADAVSTGDLLGFGDYAELSLTPGASYFGVVTEGCASRNQDVRVSNIGSVAARIDAVGLSAVSDPNFEIVSAIPAGTLLPAGGNRTVTLRMLGVPELGGHFAEVLVRASGALNPTVRGGLFGSTDSVANAARVDVYVQREQPMVDILFVIDDSGSMQNEQDSLRTNFSSFINFFTSQVSIDYHIGITTTDTTALTGALVAPYISNASVDPVAEFTAAANVGTGGSASERGLLASVQALTPPMINSGNPNYGFMRDNALLSVIYVSDEEDQSPGAVADYVDQLLAIKGYRSEMLLASAIAGDVPSGCSSANTNADSGARYLAITTSLGGTFASICAPDWSNTMEQLGLGTFNALTRFELSREPDPTSLTVIVDGVVIPQDDLNGWSFDTVTNSIVFNGTSVPTAGDAIEISYNALCIAP